VEAQAIAQIPAGDYDLLLLYLGKGLDILELEEVEVVLLRPLVETVSLEIHGELEVDLGIVRKAVVDLNIPVDVVVDPKTLGVDLDILLLRMEGVDRDDGQLEEVMVDYDDGQLVQEPVGVDHGDDLDFLEELVGVEHADDLDLVEELVGVDPVDDLDLVGVAEEMNPGIQVKVVQ
jgi:hypothetical protein